MSKEQKAAVKRFYTNWHGARKDKKNDPSKVKAFFMGGWCAMTDDEACYFITLLTKKDLKELMQYPIWL